jgi:hypothetical protein
MDHEPIFIVGCPRSGTTLLQCMLEAHPEIAIPQETSFLNLSRFHLLQRKRDPEKISHKEFEQMFLQSRHFARLNIPIQHVQDELASIPDPKWHSVWIATLRAYQKKRGKKYIGEKTPHHILHIEEIFRIFPQSKVLLLIRDPRAVVASLLKTDFSPKSTADCSMQWLTLNASGLHYSQIYPQNIFPIKYENLVSCPKDTLLAICHFLQIPFNNSMLDYHLQPHLDLNFSVEPWKIGVTHTLYSDSILRWQQELKATDIQSIETRCGTLMRLWGYPLISSGVRTHILSLLWICALFVWKRLRQFFVKDRLNIQFFKSQSLGFLHALACSTGLPHKNSGQWHQQYRPTRLPLD